MTLPMPTKPLTPVHIILNDRENLMLSKYKLETVKAIKNQFKELREVLLTNEDRDELFANTDLEVRALVEYAKSGGFAREFVYFNNKLNEACISIREAINGAMLSNVPWANMTAELIIGNYERFISLVEIHHIDLRDMAQHIRNVSCCVTALIKQIIALASAKVKEIFQKTLHFVEIKVLPVGLLAITIAATAGGIALTTDFALLMPLCINPIGAAFVLGGIATLSLTAGVNQIHKAREKSALLKRERNIVERVGLRNCRKVLDKLKQAIEEKKNYEEDQNRIHKPYRIIERKITAYLTEISELIDLRV